MIRSLSFDGYRSFQGNPHDPVLGHTIELAPLTLVIGRNNAGKTSVISLLRGLIDAIARPTPTVLPLSVGGRILGERFEDLLYARDAFGQIRIAATFHNGATFRAAVGLPGPGSDKVWVQPLPDGVIAVPPADGIGVAWSSLSTHELREAATNTCRHSLWIDALRARTPASPEGQTDPDSPLIGAHGEGTSGALYNRPKLFSAVADALAKEVGLQLRWERALHHVSLSARRGTSWVPITQLGDGIHQILPVVTTALWPQKLGVGGHVFDAILQPELHLHDALHPWLGDLLLQATQEGPRHLIVETHSEGLLLRIRRRIAEGTVPRERVALYFVDDEPLGSSLRKIHIDDNGDVADWPEGVFFSALEEVKAIRRAQRARA